MGSYGTSEFKKGLKVLIDNEPHLVIDSDFMKPGKGQAVYRIKLRNLIRGTVTDRTYRSGDKIDAADVSEGEYEYLYNDSRHWVFMNPESGEQYSIPKDIMEDSAKWLKEGMSVGIVFWGEKAITINPPKHVNLAVAYCEPATRGNTSTNVLKKAKLETGAEVNVPAFINIGDVIRVDTASGEYLERVTKSG